MSGGKKLTVNKLPNTRDFNAFFVLVQYIPNSNARTPGVADERILFNGRDDCGHHHHIQSDINSKNQLI